MDLTYLSTAKKAAIACRRIKHQYQETPEHKLMYAVLERAVYDAFVPSPSVSFKDRRSGLRYLHNSMGDAELCGVNPEWIRSTLKTAGLDIEKRWAEINGIKKSPPGAQQG